MHRFGLALMVLFSACATPPAPIPPAPAAPAETAGELREQATQAIRESRFKDARALLGRLYARDPQAGEKPEALLELAMCYPKGTLDRAERLLALVEHFPESGAAVNVLSNLSEHLGWSFSEIKVSPGPEGTQQFRATRESGPPSSYRYYRIPLEAALRSLEDPSRPVKREDWILVNQEIHEFASKAYSVDICRMRVEPGDYVVEEDIQGFKHRHDVRLSAFGLVVKSLGPKTLVYTVDLKSGEPLPAVELRLRRKDRLVSGRTGADGLAWFDFDPPLSVVAWRGEEVHELEVEGGPDASGARLFITTDRPVYRPGQLVSYKAVWRDVHDQVYEFRSGEPIQVEVRDPRGHVLETTTTAWNESGSLSGTYRLAAEPELGTYHVVVKKKPAPHFQGGFMFSQADEDDPWARGTFTVAAYRKPELAILIDPAASVTLAGEKVKAILRTEYFFGGPAAGAQVEWRVTRQIYYFPPERPPLEDPRASVYEEPDPFDGLRGIFFGDEIAKGTGRTGPDGSLQVEFTPKDDCRYYELEASVTDLSGLVVDGTGRIEVHSSGFQVSIRSPLQFVKAGDPLLPIVKVKTADGRPAGHCAVEVLAFAGRETQGALEYESYSSVKLETDEGGVARPEFRAPAGTRLRLRARVKDAAGRAAEDCEEVTLASDLSAGSPNSGIEFRVLPDRVIYEEGETVRLLVLSNQTPLTALFSIEGDTVQETRVIRLEHPSQIFEIPVRPEFAPNVFMRFMAWKDGKAIGGGYDVCIYPRRRKLDVEIATDKKAYAPGEKASVTILTRSDQGPVPAEVEVAIVDESIFAIHKDEGGDIFRAFVEPRSECTRVQASCDWANTLDGYPFDDLVPQVATAAVATSAREEPGPVRIRTRFPDTLFYGPHVRTGPDGKAHLEVEMPDSLTAWRITARAISGAERFGQGTSATLTRKDVILRLETPRYFTERDLGTVLTIVHNHLGQDAEFTVKMNLAGEAQKVLVPAGGTGKLEWKVRATEVGSLKLFAQATSAVGSDAVELEIPVRAHGTPFARSYSGKADNLWSQEIEAGAGEGKALRTLDLSVSSSGLSAIEEALPFLADYPYGCVEQTMSRFLPTLVARRAIERVGLRNSWIEAELPKMLSEGLARLYHFQHEDGGWGWWEHDPTHPFMTAYALYGLLVARRSGISVDEKVIRAGLEKLRGLAPSPFGLYVRTLAGDDLSSNSWTLVEPPAWSPEDLAYLVLAGRKELAGRLPACPPDHTDAKGLQEGALLLRAIVSLNPRDPRIGPFREWLIAHRRGEGWVSTLDTAHVIYALCDASENEQDPEVRVRLNGVEISRKLGRIRLPGSRLWDGKNRLEVERVGGGTAFVWAVLRGTSREESIAAYGSQLRVARRFERARLVGNEKKWEPLPSGSEVKVGEELRMMLELQVSSESAYVMIEAPLPAGTEAREEEPYWYDWESLWYGRLEVRDDRVSIAASHLREGREASVRLRATFPGIYHVMPSTAFPMYDPEVRGASEEYLLKIVDR